MKDKNEIIMKDLWNKYNHIKDRYEVFCLCLQGSQNYGLDINTKEYQSDIDAKAIIIPSFEDVVHNRKPISKTIIMEDNTHIDVKDIRLMFEVFKKQNINYIEILFTEYKIINPKYKELVDRLFEMAEEVAQINRNAALRTMAGMSMEKYKALKHPYPTIKDRIEKYGYDCKQLHHIVRLNYFLKAFTSGKPYRECLTAGDLDYLKWLKIPGNLDLKLAEELALKTDQENREIKDNNVLSVDSINLATIEKLNEITCEAIKMRFIEEIKWENYNEK